MAEKRLVGFYSEMESSHIPDKLLALADEPSEQIAVYGAAYVGFFERPSEVSASCSPISLRP